MSFAQRVLTFYKQLQIKYPLPKGVEVLNPYQDEKLFDLCRKFYLKFYNDDRERSIIIGINPGRLGGGLTGVPFTDPVKMESICKIPNDLQKKTELSADFIYLMINAFGGPETFYSKFYFNSVSPLGFTLDKKNLNYYDTKELLSSLEDFILSSLHYQCRIGINRKRAYCLGEGLNYKYLSQLNKREKFFHEIIPLAHPRFIMQYRRKFIDDYITDYHKKLI